MAPYRERNGLSNHVFLQMDEHLKCRQHVFVIPKTNDRANADLSNWINFVYSILPVLVIRLSS